MQRKQAAHNKDVMQRALEVQGENEADDNLDNQLKSR
jgi:hypothetical protein